MAGELANILTKDVQGTTPGSRGFLVTPDDDNDLTNGSAKALWIAEAGDLEFIPTGNADDEVIGPYAVAAGAIIPFSVRRVTEGTDATVIAIYD
jgi:hypothetical protein